MDGTADPLLRVAHRSCRWPLAHWYWGDAILVDGLLAAAATVPSAGVRAVELIRGWLERVPPGYQDALGPGAAIASLVAGGTLPALAADRFLRAVDELPALFGEVPALEPHLPQFRFGLCIDAVYHLPPALAAIGRLRSDDRLLQRAARIALEMLDRLRCPGGFAHWYDVGEDRNNQMPWSRGVGWALLGALDTAFLCEEQELRSALLAVGRELWDALRAGFDSGGWSPLLGRPDLPREASVASFVVAAAHHPLRVVPASGAVYELARRQLLASVDEEGVCRGVSADVLPQWDPASYESFDTEPSPWGQGAGLRALVSLAGGGWIPGLPLPQGGRGGDQSPAASRT
jgi:hypothetical protein